MVLHTGLDSIFNIIQENLDERGEFAFKKLEQAEQPSDLPSADVVLIGPDVLSPVKWVQQIVKWDKHASILVLAPPERTVQIKQSLQFAPFVGKNTTCVTFHPNSNLTSIIQHAAIRTRQKRSFSKMGLSGPTRVDDLSATSARLENLNIALEQAPIGVLLVDHEGKIAGANRQSRLMFHQLGEDRVQLETIFPASSLQTIWQMIKEGGTKRMQFNDKAGNFYEIASSKVTEGGATKTLLLINDITEKTERDKNIHAILESLPQMAWTTTAEGRVSYFSRMWFSYTNQTEQEAMGDGWTSVVHPDELEATLQNWMNSVKKGQVYQRAARFRRFDGQYRWHLNKAVPVYSSRREISMWVGTSTDIHDQVLLTEELEKKVRERTRSLEEANAELEQFAYVSSHDLQEPLRKIHTFASLIKDEDYDKLGSNSQKYLDKVVATAVRMSKLLKDLLSFTRLNSQEAVEEVDLGQLINSIREDLELVISEKEARLEVQNLPVLRGRRLQLKQLFYNLITNALKFQKAGEAPVVTIIARKRKIRNADGHSDNAFWEIVVQDNGIGFEQKYASQIFTIFQRLHGRNVYEGTGIGLAICRKIVSNHEGEIFASSSPGKGAKFHVILPA